MGEKRPTCAQHGKRTINDDDDDEVTIIDYTPESIANKRKWLFYGASTGKDHRSLALAIRVGSLR